MNTDQEKPDELAPDESQVDSAVFSADETFEQKPVEAQESEQSKVAETSEQTTEQLEVAETVESKAEPFEAVVVEPNELIDVETSRLEHTLEDVVALLEQLRKDFGRNLTRESKQQERIDNLYEQNVKYKDDVLWGVKKLLVENFISEVDDVEKRWPPSKLEEEIPEDYEELKKRYLRLLKYVCRELPENLRFALENCDVFAYSSEGGVEFDPKTQRAIRTTSTDRPELDRTTKSLRSGYKSIVRGQETIIRPELVEAFKYSGPASGVFEPSDAVPQEPSTDKPTA